MLVLSRQRDETIMIGDEIEITVVDIRGDKVRLGITAPTCVPSIGKRSTRPSSWRTSRRPASAGPSSPPCRGASSPGRHGPRCGRGPRGWRRRRQGARCRWRVRRCRCAAYAGPSRQQGGRYERESIGKVREDGERPESDTEHGALSLNHGGLQWLGSIRIFRASSHRQT